MEKNAVKSQKVILQKSQKLLASGQGVCNGQKPVQRLHNLPLKLTEKLFNVLNRRPFMEVLSEQFLWFLKK